MSNETGKSGGLGSGKNEKRKAGEGLSDDDDRIFHLWLESLVLQDPRYNSKAIAILAREAMTNEEFRSKVLHDPQSSLRELGSKDGLPENVVVKFFDNTDGTLNVVLPPRAGLSTRLSPTLRERLHSRTTTFSAWFHDDWDAGFFDDGHSKDPPIFKTYE